MKLTIREVIEELRTSDAIPNHSVDQLESGSLDSEVSAIATTFMPTGQVIEKALTLGANLIIAHEGIYYSHHNNVEFLVSDLVYWTKRKRIEESGISIYRYHDGCHRHDPDLIMMGLIEALAWENDIEEMLPTSAILRIPPMNMPEVTRYLKAKLGLTSLRVTGNLHASYRRIGILVGYRGGGSNAIPLLRDKQLDLLLVGEGPEWETPEYIRDAVYQGGHQALITLGHAESEEPGMSYLARQLQMKYPNIPVHFIPVGSNYHIF